MTSKTIAIVVPVFNEGRGLYDFYNRLKNIAESMPAYDWEFIFVNDGSKDNSYEILVHLANKSPNVKVIDLARNFGKEVALSAGLHSALNADAVICIDSDLQHPPELIPRFVEDWQKGAEMVVSIRTHSTNEPLIRRWGSDLFYWLLEKTSTLQITPKATDFRLFDKKVVREFCRITERDRMFRGIMDWMGFRQTFIEFTADERQHGVASYSFRKLWALAVTSLTSFSLWPLRTAGYLGIIISAISLTLLLWMFINLLIAKTWVFSPATIVIVANTFLIGIVLIAIGLVALYVGKIHTEVTNRPLYVVRESINFDDK